MSRRPRIGSVVGLTVLGVLAVAGVFFVLGGTPGASLEQPIRFNHKAHLKKEPCKTCHRFYTSREVAGRPRLAICMECHTNPVTKSAEEEKLRDISERKGELAWVRITRVPRHVRFSHQRHVVAGKVPCRTCHGAIAEATEPPARPLVDITMDFCIGCHRARKVWLAREVFQLLAEAAVEPELIAELGELRYRRFATAEKLLTAVEGVAKNRLGGANLKLLKGGIRPAPPVLVDCIACHR